MSSSPLADTYRCATFLVINNEARQLFNPSANRLAKWGLPHHERCLLCDEEEETIDHLLCISKT